jgi:hypothetical protein
VPFVSTELFMDVPADMCCIRAVQSHTYTPHTEAMAALHRRRLMWMPDLNAIASALQMNAAPSGAPSNLHDAWYKAIADRIEGEDSDSEEDD